MSRYKVEINGYTIQEYEKLSHQETMNLLDQYHQTNDENIKEKIVLSNFYDLARREILVFRYDRLR